MFLIFLWHIYLISEDHQQPKSSGPPQITPSLQADWLLNKQLGFEEMVPKSKSAGQFWYTMRYSLALTKLSYS